MDRDEEICVQRTRDLASLGQDQEAVVRSGQRDPHPPGRYRASFYTWYVFLRVGKAELTFDTTSGEPVTMWYSAPYSIYSKGAASFSPQERRPGIGVLIGVYGFCLALVLAGVLMALIGSLNG